MEIKLVVFFISSFLLIMRFFSSLFFQMLTLRPPLPWSTWQELRTESKTNSESMLSMMLEAKVSTAHLQEVLLDKYKVNIRSEHTFIFKIHVCLGLMISYDPSFPAGVRSVCTVG